MRGTHTSGRPARGPITAVLLALCITAMMIGCGRSSSSVPPPPPGPPGAAVQYRAAWARVDHDTRMAVHDFSHETLTADGPLTIDPAGAAQLDALSEVIADLIAAAAEPVCDYEVDDTLGVDGNIFHLGELRFMARLLVADAYRLAAAGQTDAAAARLLAILRSANHLRSDHRLLSSSQAVALVKFAATHAERLLDPAELSPETRADFAAAIDNLLGEDPFGAKAAIRHERLVHLTYGYSSESLDPKEFTARDRRGAEAFYDTVLEMWDAPDAEARLTDLSLEAIMEKYKLNRWSRDKHGPIAREALGGSHRLPTLIAEASAKLTSLMHTLDPSDPTPPPD